MGEGRWGRERHTQRHERRRMRVGCETRTSGCQTDNPIDLGGPSGLEVIVSCSWLPDAKITLPGKRHGPAFFSGFGFRTSGLGLQVFSLQVFRFHVFRFQV